MSIALHHQHFDQAITWIGDLPDEPVNKEQAELFWLRAQLWQSQGNLAAAQNDAQLAAGLMNLSAQQLLWYGSLFDQLADKTSGSHEDEIDAEAQANLAMAEAIYRRVIAQAAQAAEISATGLGAEAAAAASQGRLAVLRLLHVLVADQRYDEARTVLTTAQQRYPADSHLQRHSISGYADG